MTYSRPHSKQIAEMALRPKCSISTFYLTLNLELCRLTNHHKIHESRRAANILKCTGNLYLLKVKSLSRFRLFATPWTAAYQALPSMGFSRHEYWSGVPSPSPSFQPAAAAAAKSLQSCPTLCDPIDSSPPGSPVPGILQARTLEWVAISFSNA